MPGHKEETKVKLKGVILTSENPEALCKFYSDIIGCLSAQKDGWYSCDARDAILTFGPSSEMESRTQPPAG